MAAIALCSSNADAFQHTVRHMHVGSPRVQPSEPSTFDESSKWVTPSFKPTVDVLTNLRSRSIAYAKKGGPADDSQPPEKSSPLDYFILYMTPWKNPNSIFVYFILIINLLSYLGLGPPPHD